jgi:hypothetical protein
MSKPMKRNLDDVLLTEAAVAAYEEFALRVAQVLAATYGASLQIPDEQCEEMESGSLRIFVTLPNGTESSMEIPKGDWAWNPSAVN